MTLDLDLDPVNPEQRRGHVGWRVPAATTTHLHLGNCQGGMGHSKLSLSSLTALCCAATALQQITKTIAAVLGGNDCR